MNRARRPLLLFALLSAAPVLVAAPWAFAAMADAAPPTITFAATGTVPLACGSHPSVSSLQVKTGTAIVFANNTGVTGTLTVGGVKVSDVDPGMGAVVRLRKGQHEVRLAPQCVVVNGTDAVVVNVQPGAEVNGNAPATGDPEPSGEPPAVMVEPTVPVPDDSPVAAGSRPASVPSRGTAGGTAPTATALPVANPRADEGDSPMESVVIDVKAIPVGDPRDPKDGRLLAVIAAICVIGVTAAIIRAIVSQRTSSAVRA